MKRINRDMSTTFVFSTHDRLIMGEARRVVELHDGLVQKDERRES